MRVLYVKTTEWDMYFIFFVNLPVKHILNNVNAFKIVKQDNKS